MGLTPDKAYELAKHLHDASLLMKELDEPRARILIDMASDVLDLLSNSKFTRKESDEIDGIVKELENE